MHAAIHIVNGQEIEVEHGLNPHAALREHKKSCLPCLDGRYCYQRRILEAIDEDCTCRRVRVPQQADERSTPHAGGNA